jgi:hypothetical protein
MKNNNTATPQLEQTTRWARLKATNFWQAAFIRPFPSEESRWKTRLASTLSYAFGPLLILLMSASLIDGYMTSVIPLESMHKTTGVLQSVTSCIKCPSLFEVRQQNGTSTIFSSYPGELNKLRLYTGTDVTVWSQVGFQLPTLGDGHFFFNKVYEIKIQKNSEFLNKYDKNRDKWLMQENSQRWWDFVFLLVGIWLPFRVWWKHRRVF